MTQVFKNNAYSSLAAELSAGGTLASLATGHGARFPAPASGDHFLATLILLNDNGSETAWEIVKCTARATDGLTIVRAQEGTPARLWPAGTRIELRTTAGTLDSFTDTTQAAAAAPVQSVAGKTGAVALVKGDVGLGNVDNTSDANKPVSAAQQTALSGKENSGTAATAVAAHEHASDPHPQYLTQPEGDARYTSPAQVNTAIAALVGSAPGTLDTLNELATALGNDPNFATTVAAQIGTKADAAATTAALAGKLPTSHASDADPHPQYLTPAEADSRYAAPASIPTKVSQLNNDSGFQTAAGRVANAGAADAVPWGGVAGRPTNLSQFSNDAGYQTGSGSVNYANSAGTIPAATAVALLAGHNVQSATFRATSDLRLKSELQVIDSALDKLALLTGYTYLLKGQESRTASIGAQDLERVLPEAVSEDNDGIKSIDLAGPIAILVNAVNELRAELSSLKTTVQLTQAGSL